MEPGRDCRAFYHFDSVVAASRRRPTTEWQPAPEWTVFNITVLAVNVSSVLRPPAERSTQCRSLGARLVLANSAPRGELAALRRSHPNCLLQDTVLALPGL